ncbi:hypothetical protein EEDFHM_04633 [Methylorubrum populi]
MAEIIRFPSGGRVPATTIPRAEFERLAELALDVVDRIILLLDDADGNPDEEDNGDAEPSLAAPTGGRSQRIWAAGSAGDFEAE